MSDLFKSGPNAILADWPGPDALLDWAMKNIPGPDVVIGVLVGAAEAAVLFILLVIVWKLRRRLFGSESPRRKRKSNGGEV